jgi:hypothetical protein
VPDALAHLTRQLHRVGADQIAGTAELVATLALIHDGLQEHNRAPASKGRAVRRGHRLLDGRQVAVIATLTAGDPAGALALLDASTTHQPWEHAVAACLTVLSGRTTDPAVTAMLHHYQHLTPPPELAVFHTRLGLSVLDAADTAHHPDTQTLATTLIRQTLATRDGYAIRDLLAHPHCAALLTTSDTSHARDILHQCCLGAKYLPAHLHDALTTAMNTTAALLISHHSPEHRASA